MNKMDNLHDYCKNKITVGTLIANMKNERVVCIYRESEYPHGEPIMRIEDFNVLYDENHPVIELLDKEVSSFDPSLDFSLSIYI